MNQLFVNDNELIVPSTIGNGFFLLHKVPQSDTTFNEFCDLNFPLTCHRDISGELSLITAIDLSAVLKELEVVFREDIKSHFSIRHREVVQLVKVNGTKRQCFGFFVLSNIISEDEDGVRILAETEDASSVLFDTSRNVVDILDNINAEDIVDDFQLFDEAGTLRIIEDVQRNDILDYLSSADIQYNINSQTAQGDNGDTLFEEGRIEYETFESNSSAFPHSKSDASANINSNTFGRMMNSTDFFPLAAWKTDFREVPDDQNLSVKEPKYQITTGVSNSFLLLYLANKSESPWMHFLQGEGGSYYAHHDYLTDCILHSTIQLILIPPIPEIHQSSVKAIVTNCEYFQLLKLFHVRLNQVTLIGYFERLSLDAIALEIDAEINGKYYRPSVVPGIVFTSALDERLMTSVRQFGSNLNWDEVAAYVGSGLTAKQCSERWSNNNESKDIIATSQRVYTVYDSSDEEGSANDVDTPHTSSNIRKLTTGPLTAKEVDIINEVIENRFNYDDYFKVLVNRLNRSRSDINRYLAQRHIFFVTGHFNQAEDDVIIETMTRQEDTHTTWAWLSKRLRRKMTSLKIRWAALKKTLNLKVPLDEGKA